MSIPWLQKLLSPYGLSSEADEVSFCCYEISSKVLVFSFSAFIPLLISKQGDEEFGEGRGKVIWSYTVGAMSIVTLFTYIIFLGVLDFGWIKRKALINASIITALIMTLFIFSFAPSAIYLSCILAISGKTCQRIADVAFESLIDAVAKDELSAHALSSRAQASGFVGVIAFIILVLCPIAGSIFLFTNLSAIWTNSIIPNILVGLWSLTFALLMNTLLPQDIGKGPPLLLPNIICTCLNSKNSIISKNSNHYQDDDDDDNDNDSFDEMMGDKTTSPSVASSTLQNNDSCLQFLSFIIKAGMRGTKEQWNNLAYMKQLPDLTWFYVSAAFTNAATQTASSVIIILAVEVLKLEAWVLGTGFVIALLSAIYGVVCYRYITVHKILSVKQVLLINLTVLACVSAISLFITAYWQILLIMAIAGFQIGSLGSFTRSLVSILIPKERQSRLFSLYELVKDGTAWIPALIIATLSWEYPGARSYQIIVTIVGAVSIIIGLPILAFKVDITRGRITRMTVENEDILNSSKKLKDEESSNIDRSK